MYGIPPPLHVPYFPKDSSIEVVDNVLRDREATIQLLKHSLSEAQQRMVIQANKHRTERSFQIGDMVFLKLQPYIQSSLVVREVPKLAA